jgi:Fic family protein
VPTWDVRFNLRIDQSDYRLVSAIAKTDALAYIVRGIPIPPSVYDRLDQLNILRAVRGTTGIEGADLSEEDVARVLQSEENVLGSSRTREEREARNAAAVMRMVADVLSTDPARPLSESLICEIHKLTTEGIEYPHNTPGVYRSHAVHAADYVPPRDSQEVQALMSRFVEWLNLGQGKDLPAVVRAIAAHFYFISIHPFGDGNGRTARAIESYLLYQGQVNVVGFYSLSNFYYRRRADYVEMLDYVRFQSGGNLTPFVQFALDGLVEELESVRKEVIHAVTEIVYRDYVRQALARASADAQARMRVFLDYLTEPVPIREIRSGRHLLSTLYRGLSARTLSRDLKFLEESELIKRENGLVSPNLEVMNRFTR